MQNKRSTIINAFDDGFPDVTSDNAHTTNCNINSLKELRC